MVENSRKWYESLTDRELKYIRKKMNNNYVKVKRINFKISESYLKDCREIEDILLGRYYDNRKKQKELDEAKKVKRYGKKRKFVK